MIIINVKFATSISDQLFGLLKKSNPRALVFRTRCGIHTFGLKNPIDVLVLDNKSRVVKLKKNLKTFRIFLWNPKYNTVVELPAGLITKTKTQIGDTVKLKRTD